MADNITQAVAPVVRDEPVDLSLLNEPESKPVAPNPPVTEEKFAGAVDMPVDFDEGGTFPYSDAGVKLGLTPATDVGALEALGRGLQAGGIGVMSGFLNTFGKLGSEHSAQLHREIQAWMSVNQQTNPPEGDTNSLLDKGLYWLGAGGVPIAVGVAGGIPGAAIKGGLGLAALGTTISLAGQTAVFAGMEFGDDVDNIHRISGGRLTQEEEYGIGGAQAVLTGLMMPLFGNMGRASEGVFSLINKQVSLIMTSTEGKAAMTGVGKTILQNQLDRSYWTHATKGGLGGMIHAGLTQPAVMVGISLKDDYFEYATGGEEAMRSKYGESWQQFLTDKAILYLEMIPAALPLGYHGGRTKANAEVEVSKKFIEASGLQSGDFDTRLNEQRTTFQSVLNPDGKVEYNEATGPRSRAAEEQAFLALGDILRNSGNPQLRKAAESIAGFRDKDGVYHSGFVRQLAHGFATMARMAGDERAMPVDYIEKLQMMFIGDGKNPGISDADLMEIGNSLENPSHILDILRRLPAYETKISSIANEATTKGMISEADQITARRTSIVGGSGPELTPEQKIDLGAKLTGTVGTRLGDIQTATGRLKLFDGRQTMDLLRQSVTRPGMTEDQIRNEALFLARQLTSYGATLKIGDITYDAKIDVFDAAGLRPEEQFRLRVSRRGAQESKATAKTIKAADAAEKSKTAATVEPAVAEVQQPVTAGFADDSSGRMVKASARLNTERAAERKVGLMERAVREIVSPTEPLPVETTGISSAISDIVTASEGVPIGREAPPPAKLPGEVEGRIQQIEEGRAAAEQQAGYRKTARFEGRPDAALGQTEGADGPLKGVYIPGDRLAVFFRRADAGTFMEEWMHHVTKSEMLPEHVTRPLLMQYGSNREKETGSIIYDATHENIARDLLRYIRDGQLSEGSSVDMKKAFDFLKGQLNSLADYQKETKNNLIDQLPIPFDVSLGMQRADIIDAINAGPALAQRATGVAVEAAPGSDSTFERLFSGKFFGLPLEKRTRVNDLLVNDAATMAAESLGIKPEAITSGIGRYEDYPAGPNNFIILPEGLPDTQRRAFMAEMGLILQQSAVDYIDLSKPGEKLTAVFRKADGTPLTEAERNSVYDHLRTKDKGLYTGFSELKARSGEPVMAIGIDLPIAEQARIKNLIVQHTKELGIDIQHDVLYSSYDRVKNDWKENPNGTEYNRYIRESGEVGAINFADRYTPDAFTAKWRAAVEGTAEGRGALAQRGSGGTIPITRWDNERGLERFDPRFHGGGLKGGELARKRDYPEIYQDRVYFGLDGYKKEAGLGPNKYKMEVDRGLLYDMDTDPLGLYEKAAKKAERTYGPDPQARITMYEKAIKEAGFAGAYSPSQKVGYFLRAVPVTERLTRSNLGEQRRAGGDRPLLQRTERTRDRAEPAEDTPVRGAAGREARPVLEESAPVENLWGNLLREQPQVPPEPGLNRMVRDSFESNPPSIDNMPGLMNYLNEIGEALPAEAVTGVAPPAALAQKSPVSGFHMRLNKNVARIANQIIPGGNFDTLKSLGYPTGRSTEVYDETLLKQRMVRLTTAVMGKGGLLNRPKVARLAILKEVLADTDRVRDEIVTWFKNLPRSDDAKSDAPGGPRMWNFIKSNANWLVNKNATWNGQYDTMGQMFAVNDANSPIIRHIVNNLMESDRAYMKLMFDLQSKDQKQQIEHPVNFYDEVLLDGRTFTKSEAMKMYFMASGKAVGEDVAGLRKLIDQDTLEVKVSTERQRKLFALMASNENIGLKSVTQQSINDAVRIVNSDPALKSWAEHFRKTYEEIWQNSNDMMENIYTRGLGKMNDWYSPITRPDGMKGDAIVEQMDAGLNVQPPGQVRGVPVPAYAKERRALEGAPVNLDFVGERQQYVEKMNNWVARVVPVTRILKVMTDEQVKRGAFEAFGGKNGRNEVWDRFTKAVGQSAFPSGRKDPFGFGEQTLRTLRSNTVLATLGLKPYLELTNALSMVTALGEVPIKQGLMNYASLMQYGMRKRAGAAAKLKLDKNPLAGHPLFEQAIRETPEIALPYIHLDVQEMMRRNPDVIDRVIRRTGLAADKMELAFYGIAFQDLVTRTAIFSTARDAKLAELSERGIVGTAAKDEAIRYGESVVRNHVPTFLNSRMVGFQTAHEGIRALFPFMSQPITYNNTMMRKWVIPFTSAYKMAQGGEGAKLKEAFKSVGSLETLRQAFFYVALPAILYGALQRKRWPDEKEAMADILTYPLSSTVLGPVGNAIQSASTYGGGLRVPGIIWMQDAQKTVNALGKTYKVAMGDATGKEVAKWYKDAVNLPSDVFGIPKFVTYKPSEVYEIMSKQQPSEKDIEESIRLIILGGQPRKKTD